MSKRARVDLANILLRAGYNKIKILRAIKYPFCNAVFADVRYAEIPTDDMSLSIIFEPFYNKNTTIKTGSLVELEDPMPPSFTRLEYSQSVVFYFYYEGSNIAQSRYQPNEVMIPPPPEWPSIGFADSKT